MCSGKCAECRLVVTVHSVPVCGCVVELGWLLLSIAEAPRAVCERSFRVQEENSDQSLLRSEMMVF